MLCWFSRVRLFATLWTVAHQSPLSMGFSRPEYWSGLPCPLPEGPPDPGIEPESLMSPALAGGFFTTSDIWEAKYSISYLLSLPPTTTPNPPFQVVTEPQADLPVRYSSFPHGSVYNSVLPYRFWSVASGCLLCSCASWHLALIPQVTLELRSCLALASPTPTRKHLNSSHCTPKHAHQLTDFPKSC